jgi:drug/metabolite transporter (DMT)-like permease
MQRKSATIVSLRNGQELINIVDRRFELCQAKQLPEVERKMETSNRPNIPPLAGIAVALIAVSTSSIITRYAQAYASSLVIAAYRLGISALLLWPFTLARHRPALRSLSRKQLALTLLSGTFLAIHFMTWITSLEYTTVASSVVLVSTLPLFVALLAPITIGEPITRGIVIGLILALSGSAIVGLSDACTWEAGLQCPPLAEFMRGGALLGDLLALAGALSGAGYMLIGRKLRPQLPLLPYISLVYSIAAVILVLTMFGAGQPATGYPAEAYLWFLLLALLPQLIAHSTFNWALRYLPSSYVSITTLGEPIGSTILAFLLLGERPPGLMLVGGILILAGIAVASRPNPALRSQSEETQTR